MYDCENEKSFDNIESWRNDFLLKSNIKAEKEFPFIMFGNKFDLPVTRKRVNKIKVDTFCKNNGNIIHYDTSAKTALNVEQGFNKIAKMAIDYNERYQTDIYVPDDITKRLTEKPPEQSKCKCQLL